MNDKSAGGVHWSFWAIGAIGLIWNIMGIINYLVQMDPDTLETMAQSHRTLIEGRPIWATAGFAIAVFGGALGCLMLLFRKSVAYYLLIASLLGVIVQLVHTLAVAGTTVDFGPVDISMTIVLPLVVAAFLVWYSAKARRWIG